ncbi:MAG: hypothetical protein WC869_10505 [Phycisphaerae bacterium]|jgi:hypothetical protein
MAELTVSLLEEDQQSALWEEILGPGDPTAAVEPVDLSPRTELARCYRELVDTTAAAALAEATMKEAERMMLETASGRAYLAAKAASVQAEADRIEADCAVRGTALGCYQADPDNKHPHHQVSIRVNLEMQVLSYDRDGANVNLLGWAEKHPDLGLIAPASVNMRKFEKYARAVREVAPLEFVEWREVPTVAISLEE